MKLIRWSVNSGCSWVFGVFDFLELRANQINSSKKFTFYFKYLLKLLTKFWQNSGIKKLLPALLAGRLTFGPLASISAAPPKAGSICAKLGQTQTASKVKFTCIKSGKKLVWDKGILISKPTPSASHSSIPTPTPTPTSTPAPTPTSTSIPKIEQLSTSDFRLLAQNALSAVGSQPNVDSSSMVKIQPDTKTLFTYFLDASKSDRFSFFGPDPLKLSGINSSVGLGIFDPQSRSGVFKSISALPPWGIGFKFSTLDSMARFQVLTRNNYVPGAGEPYINRSWRLAFRSEGGTWHYQSIEGISHQIGRAHV